ncbi:MAG TPA: hypothetical protein VGQ99_16750 [Tepidisphaeraceae bacterium]|jgi:hypothetical protein|nr:hypothetical protein [Tepidisphaeraceae bacterium]
MNDTTTTAAPTSSAPPPAAPFPFFAYILLALVCACVVAAGLALIFWSPDAQDAGTVREVRITAKNSIDPQKFEEVLDTPDYYLELLTDQGSIRTRTFKDTRVGSGLTFKLPVPVPLAAVKELKIWDEEAIGKDKQMDRVDRPDREVDGEKFHFVLTGYIPPRSHQWKLGLALAICAGAILLLTLLKFIRAQVV